MSTDAEQYDARQWERERNAAAANPVVGMAFHEMYSYWVFVVAVTDHVVQVVHGGGHPTHFPECGALENVPRAEFPRFVQYTYATSKRYSVNGWAPRAEGITVKALEERIRATGHRAGEPA